MGVPGWFEINPTFWPGELVVNGGVAARRSAFAPEGHLRIAQRFIAGLSSGWIGSPVGTIE